MGCDGAGVDVSRRRRVSGCVLGLLLAAALQPGCRGGAQGTEPPPGGEGDGGDDVLEAGTDAHPFPMFDGSFVVDLGVLVRPDGGVGSPGDAEVDVEVGPPGPGETCALARPWPAPVGAPLVGTTSAGVHRENLSCAGTGAGVSAPAAWWSLALPGLSHVALRLGTQGWDGVLATRTPTCATSGETCANAPPIVELPAVSGPLQVGVSGFSDGRGAYVLGAEIGPPLTVPPANASCGAATPAPLPAALTGHNFGATATSSGACPGAGEVFYRLDLPAAAPLSVRLEPLAGQSVSFAVLDTLCQRPLACGTSAVPGGAAWAGPVALAAGTFFIAAGTPGSAGAPGSFRLLAAENAACRSDADCALGSRCGDGLTCSAPAGFVATSSRTLAIPDGQGSLDVSIMLAGPAGRPARVRVRLRFAHPAVQDLVVLLTSPASPAAITVRLRDRSPGALDVVYGSDRPADGPGRLEDFGLLTGAAGTWTLHIEDRARGDPGSLSGYALEAE